MTTKQTLDRRKFLARAGAAAAGVAATPLLNLADLAGAESPRPNVLILLADDTGWNDVGYNGSEIRTPHIDRLASEGVRLDQYYVYPTCSPSRVALLSGRPPSRWGILGPIAGKSTLALPPETVTLPRILSRVGYETAITVSGT